MRLLTKITKMSGLSGWGLALGVVLLLQACRAEPDQGPKDLIPQDKMARILTEIHLAEARISKMGISSMDSSNLLYKELEGRLFKKYKVDTAVYQRSYTYYSMDPNKMADIYKRVTEELERRKTPAKKDTKDSLPKKSLPKLNRLKI
jgi:hypothetical protein